MLTSGLWLALLFGAPEIPIYWDKARSNRQQQEAADAAALALKQPDVSPEAVFELLSDGSARVRDRTVLELSTWPHDRLALLARGLLDRRTLVVEGVAEVYARAQYRKSTPLILKRLKRSLKNESLAVLIGAVRDLNPIDHARDLKRLLKATRKQPALQLLVYRALLSVSPELATEAARSVKRSSITVLARLEALSVEAPRALLEEIEAVLKVSPFQSLPAERVLWGTLRYLRAIEPNAEDTESWRRIVDRLIELLESQSGRSLSELEHSLEHITGEKLTGADLWSAWWRQRSGWEAGSRKAEDAERARTGVIQYHGIAVDSNRSLFLIDLSGGMSRSLGGATAPTAKSRLDVAKEELNRVLTKLAPGCQVGVVGFGSDYSPWADELQPLARVRPQLREHVEELSVSRVPHANRGNLYDTLAYAVTHPQVDTVYVLSEGAPTEGKFIEPDRFLDHFERLWLPTQTRVHVISIGRSSASNRDFLKRLAELTGGEIRWNLEPKKGGEG